MILNNLRSLFWDIDVTSFNPETYPEYTILRVLEFGNAEAVSWLLRMFSEIMIASVIRNDRRLSRKSANFWALAYKVPVEEVAALRWQSSGGISDCWKHGYGTV